MAPVLRLVVGLGNPTPSYRHTRHNVGRDYVEFAAASAQEIFRSMAQAEFISTRLGSALANDLLFVKLSCFMNQSGLDLKKFMYKKSIKIDEILVIVDEFMIPFGTLRLGKKGSAGGHNGMKSIIETLGTEEFCRLRVGIGPVPPEMDPADFVLEKFTKSEIQSLPKIFDAISSGLKVYANNGFEKAATFANKNHL